MKSKTDDPQTAPRPKPSLKLRLTVALLSPLLFLLVIEGLLRIIGFGIPTTFYVPWSFEGQTLQLSNPHFCEHFVPKARSRAPETSVLMQKPSNTFRIFVLGGSAANGDPAPAYGFCRQLEFLLNESCVQTKFEVVNVAVTSMNSHVARRIAVDCARQQPDLFIVYIGNNEVVGPYGPPTLPTGLYRSRAFINASITTKKDLRIGQLLKQTAEGMQTGTSDKWMGMETFLESKIPHNDPKLTSCHAHFQANLKDIIATAESVGAKTLLCTVPTNLAACPPFTSVHGPDLTPFQKESWQQAFDKGRDLQTGGDFQAALVSYQQAWQLDNQFAELAYCMGICHLDLDQWEPAREFLKQARDLDALRFRADSDINRIVRETALAHRDQGAALLDLVEALEQLSDGRPLDDQYLVDHVHLTVPANFAAAQAATQCIAQQYPQLPIASPESPDPSLFKRCQQRLLYDIHEQYRLALLMYYRKTRPPFVEQLDHDTELATLRTHLIQLRTQVQKQPLEMSALATGLAQFPHDTMLVRRYVDALIQHDQPNEASLLLDKLIPQRPYDMDLRSAHATALVAIGMPEAALAALTTSDSPFHYNRLEALEVAGGICVQQKRYQDVYDIYRELLDAQPRNVDIMVSYASATSRKGDVQTSLQYLQKALELDSQNVPALINLGNYYSHQEKTQQAHDWFERAVEADPYDYIPRFNLGIQKVKLGHIREGTKLLTEAVTLKPDFVQGYESLGELFERFNKPELAARYHALGQLFAP